MDTYAASQLPREPTKDGEVEEQLVDIIQLYS